ncbi:zinc finger protein 397-like isoform X1 [Oryzias latipes]|uniref:zinc finger protein 397-like isoform X1 n=1 Tax=Oryzias latipes TaxID=8090 RepID=UPI0002A48BD4|nr:zinc finger protein 397-like isoform X1 [Oryzias latipes]
MSSVQSLREFISEQLTAAAEEIFRQFEKTIVHYEEEMDRQRRLLDNCSSWRVPTNPHRPDLEPPGVFEEDQPLWNQERSSSLRELQVKEEQEEPCSSQERWQENNVSSVKAPFEAESRCEQLLSQIPLVPQDQQGGAYMEFDGDAEVMSQQRPNRRGCTDPEGAFLPERDFMIENDNRVCKCSICGKSLKDKYSLKVHNKIHTGEKAFSCHMCGKRFRYKHALKVHVRIHTNEKPFSCRVCGETFRQSSNLISHLKRHQEHMLLPSSQGRR